MQQQQQQPLPQVKQNDDAPFYHHPPTVKQEDRVVNVDDLIQGFKNNDYNLESIQEKLMSILSFLTKEDEEKLEVFLHELISQNQNAPAGIQDEVMQDTTNLGYSYPANLVGQTMPQYPYGGYQQQYIQQQQQPQFRQYPPNAQFARPALPQGQFYPQQPPMGVMYPGAPGFPGVVNPEMLRQQQQMAAIRPPPNQQQQPGMRPPPGYPYGGQQGR